MHDVFFFTDVHGCKYFYDAFMKYINNVDPESTIIFGGDACDRGEQGFEIINQLLNNPNIVYLKGNHEDLFVKAARELYKIIETEDIDVSNLTDQAFKEILNYIVSFYNSGDTSLHLYNGGFYTLKDWIQAGMDMKIINQLDHLPLVFSYENIDFCHAGGLYSNFCSLSDDAYNNIEPTRLESKIAIWSRSYFNMNWAPGRIYVHGHTPATLLPFRDGQMSEQEVVPVKYNGRNVITKDSGYKLDMDTGMVFTNRAFLYNCSTNKITGFFRDEKTKEITIQENIMPYIRGEDHE